MLWTIPVLAVKLGIGVAAAQSPVPPPIAPAHRALALEDRVSAQRAIEEVYWRHRIWPSGNPTPKPSLAATISDEAIRARVDDYLRKSNVLESLWGRAITPEQLQAELDRMTSNTRSEIVLRELFAALNDDPFVIAETLARETLADRLIRESYGGDDRFHGQARTRAKAAASAASSVSDLQQAADRFDEVTFRRATVDPVSGDIALGDSDWNGLIADLDEPSGDDRGLGSVIPTLGSELSRRFRETDEGLTVTLVLERTPELVRVAVAQWPKQSFDSWWAERPKQELTQPSATDFKYSIVETDMLRSCVTDSWSATSTVGAPSPRYTHDTGIWTGSEFVVWGGFDGALFFNDGGRYNPATDSWRTTGVCPIEGRNSEGAVWTGREVIVWGGRGSGLFNYLDSGGRYDPVTNTWRVTSPVGAPHARSDLLAVWTGTQMIVWGGQFHQPSPPTTLYPGAGGRYNPSTDTWLPTTEVDAPPGAWLGAAVWTGSKMVVWGGENNDLVNSGGRYDPVADRWERTSTIGAPSARSWFSAVWTGREMVVWGGVGAAAGAISYRNDGGRYDPQADHWLPMQLTGAPSPRGGSTAIWTGRELIVWGGEFSPQSGNYNTLNTGGRYDPQLDSWTATSLTNAPTDRARHAAIWTGNEMIVWGGSRTMPSAYWNTGGRYCVASCDAPATWYQDWDHDGHGLASVSVLSCSPPEGYVASSDDCDDTNPAIHPGAVETCNGIDDDCDGTIDNGGAALCDDGNGCTDDTCGGTAGCAHTDNAAPCDDGNVCTVGDTCSGGVCEPGSPLNCDDNNCCTIDSCDPASGCVHMSNPTTPVFTTQPSLGGIVLWPPNHGYVDFSVADTGAAASSQCGVTSIQFASCSSSQPENATGAGDGNTTRDCVYEPGALHLRAEQDGSCSPVGRMYASTLIAIDACGHTSVSNPVDVPVWPGPGHPTVQGSVRSSTGNGNDVRNGTNGTYGIDCGSGGP